jgi:glucose-6-phosphate isomerase
MNPLPRHPAWAALARHAKALRPRHLADLFAEDARRFERFHLRFGNELMVDFAKQRIDMQGLALLHDLARAADVLGWIRRMFAGEAINTTEKRAVLHTALRNRANHPVIVDGQDVMPAVNAVLARMGAFTRAVHDGNWAGATGQRIRHVVNIGIGGSDLGPAMAAQALTAFHVPGIQVRFVSNVDGSHLLATLADLDPATTLFVVASKTFTTQETMANAATARAWTVAKLGEAAVAKHFVAVSTNAKAVAGFGIDTANMFEFWDWVGGRYSVWSAIGLSVMLAVGSEHFATFLDGAHAMDEHFRTAPAAQNLPLTLALLSVWNTNFLDFPTQALLPYDQLLARLPAWLQQGAMESNGKSIGRDGQPVENATSPIVWGEPGTNGQHAFYQLLHQGTQIVPCDFIAAAKPAFADGRHHAMLLANCLAQSEAMAFGQTAPAGQPWRAFAGNRPSTTILLDALTPRTLGLLMALYEHRIFVEGVIWGVHSFDQFGVELGKQLANTLLPEVEGGPPGRHDSSTLGLVRQIRDWL